jgi:hypothetical protein
MVECYMQFSTSIMPTWILFGVGLGADTLLLLLCERKWIALLLLISAMLGELLFGPERPRVNLDQLLL